MSDHSDDAQRKLERKALANVRALLDKLEAEERERIPGALKLLVLVLLIGSVAVVCVGIGVMYWPERSTAPESKVIAQPAPTRNEGKEGGASEARDDEVPNYRRDVR